MALAFPFMAVNVLYVTYARLARRVRRVFSVQVAVAASVLSLTWLLVVPLGLTGAGVAYLGSQAAMAVIVFPSVRRQFLRPDMRPGFAPDARLVARNADGFAPSPAELPSTTDTIVPPTAGADGRWLRRLLTRPSRPRGRP